VLYNTYTWSPDEKIAGWRSHGGEASPSNTGTIAVGTQTESTGASDGTVPTGSARSLIKTVPDPTDLTGLSTELSKFFERWNTPERRFSLCFDSITPLLTYVSVSRACRFLDVLTSRVEVGGAIAHYHLNPDAHTDETVDKLVPLFDDVIDRTETG
jgi:hypothetical protein